MNNLSQSDAKTVDLNRYVLRKFA